MERAGPRYALRKANTRAALARDNRVQGLTPGSGSNTTRPSASHQTEAGAEASANARRAVKRRGVPEGHDRDAKKQARPRRPAKRNCRERNKPLLMQLCFFHAASCIRQPHGSGGFHTPQARGERSAGRRTTGSTPWLAWRMPWRWTCSPAGAPPSGVLTGGVSLPVTPRAALTCPGPPQREGGKMDRDRYSDAPRARLLVAEGRGPGLPESVRCVTLTAAGAASRVRQVRTPPEDAPRWNGTGGVYGRLKGRG